MHRRSRYMYQIGVDVIFCLDTIHHTLHNFFRFLSRSLFVSIGQLCAISCIVTEYTNAYALIAILLISLINII